MKKILSLLFFLPLLIQAQNNKLTKKGIDTEQYVPKGIELNSKAPLINATTIDGEQISSEEILQDKQIVVIFYRGQWCPICNRYLSNLNDSIQHIENKNALVVVVGPESDVNAKITQEKANASFKIIADTDLSIQQSFDVLFYVTKAYQNKITTFLNTSISENNNQDKAQLPVPATFIIDQKGNISFKHFDYDYSKRASILQIVNAL